MRPGQYWLWLKQKLMELLNDQGPVPAPNNHVIVMLMYYRQEIVVIFILGTYMELVDREVIGKQKELLVETVQGVLGAKIED